MPGNGRGETGDAGFLNAPNLPQHPVRLCAVGAAYVQLFTGLTERGIGLLPIPPDPRLPAPICCHPDLQLCHLGGEHFLTTAPSVKRRLLEEGAVVEEAGALAGKYPGDVPLNAALLGRRCFCRRASTHEKLLQRMISQEKDIIDVAQGYARCSVCMISEDAIITADPSIARAARAVGVEVLQIEAGGILLPGYSHGFLGGCCGLIDRKVLAVAGELCHHPSCWEMERFLSRHQIAVVALMGGPLLDVGGILPVKEYR